MKQITVRGKNAESAMPPYLVPYEFFNIKVLEATEEDLTLTGTVTTASLNVTTTLGVFGETPVGQQEVTTAALTDLTSDEPGTPNYTPVTTDTDAFGFSTEDDLLTVLSIIKNLQTRINELETALQTYGILA